MKIDIHLFEFPQYIRRTLINLIVFSLGCGAAIAASAISMFRDPAIALFCLAFALLFLMLAMANAWYLQYVFNAMVDKLKEAVQ